MVVTMKIQKPGEQIGDAGGESNDDVNDPEQEIPPPERLLLPIQCSLVDEFVGDIKENLETSNM